ncbi:hypothetical protein EVAR_23429_1 [Eumeta japonica]|uniref:MADF domain-containing protein n=1 Tax=Eumeta variegata TaxID=151549 RepID=A0A4C1UK07_EUMVA|nr:hypothetical protein EVAR_23429_1 [Eumeta japonica]
MSSSPGWCSAAVAANVMTTSKTGGFMSSPRHGVSRLIVLSQKFIGQFALGQDQIQTFCFEAMNIGVEELKVKRKSLMASFRPLINKKKASLRSGSSAEEVYHPTWFAYDVLSESAVSREGLRNKGRDSMLYASSAWRKEHLVISPV